eukprot:878898-Rhodomonas_salina.2
MVPSTGPRYSTSTVFPSDERYSATPPAYLPRDVRSLLLSLLRALSPPSPPHPLTPVLLLSAACPTTFPLCHPPTRTASRFSSPSRSLPSVLAPSRTPPVRSLAASTHLFIAVLELMP